MEEKIVANRRGYNKENIKKLEAYLKLHDPKPNIQDNRGLRKPAQ